MSTKDTSMPGEILDFYGESKEAERLARGIGPLELARTQELLQRFLPPAPAVICDVGGGPGVYAFWLAGLGYTTHLVDVTPLHIEQARQRATQAGSPQLASIEQGDARRLAFAEETIDAVILHGASRSASRPRRSPAGAAAGRRPARVRHRPPRFHDRGAPAWCRLR
jgi:hypothetical protein